MKIIERLWIVLFVSLGLVACEPDSDSDSDRRRGDLSNTIPSAGGDNSSNNPGESSIPGSNNENQPDPSEPGPNDNPMMGGDNGEGDPNSPTNNIKFPVSLQTIGTPQANTANVALYFTVADSEGAPVTGLTTDDFIANEDERPLDRFESAFRAEKAAGLLRVPTVLVLDLSRSVVQAGALDVVKQAAKQVITELEDNQELAILTFAGDVTLRSCFTNSRQEHLAAIDSINDADGVSTNLYGAMARAYSMFEDGFFVPRVESNIERDQCRVRRGGSSENGDRPALVSGMVVVLTDGNDTAGLATLDEARQAQDGRRTLFIRVGQELDRDVASVLGNVGVIEAQGGFDDLIGAVSNAIERTQKLNDAIYIAEYCSPKRAGNHSLIFTVKGNETYLNEPQGQSCMPAGEGIEQGNRAVCFREGREYRWCPRSAPYWCPGSVTCYELQSVAVSECGGSCLVCGQRNENEESDRDFSSGLAIIANFSARNFEDSQCEDLFNMSMPEDEMMTPGMSGGALVCSECSEDSDCSELGEGARCTQFSDSDSYCTVRCREDGWCARGFDCNGEINQCIPENFDCTSCPARPCPDGQRCAGSECIADGEGGEGEGDGPAGGADGDGGEPAGGADGDGGEPEPEPEQPADGAEPAERDDLEEWDNERRLCGGEGEGPDGDPERSSCNRTSSWARTCLEFYGDVAGNGICNRAFAVGGLGNPFGAIDATWRDLQNRLENNLDGFVNPFLGNIFWGNQYCEANCGLRCSRMIQALCLDYQRNQD